MRVLLVGATGLIGSAIHARLARDGVEVVAVARPGGTPAAAPAGRWIERDVAAATAPADWLPHLAGVDAVVNAAGVLQDSPRDSTAGVHHLGPQALYQACRQAGVERVVHLSAVGVDRAQETAFSRSKAAGDADLMALALDWVVLRPSVVVGRGAYGASALFRGLAALPWLPLMPETGPLQIVCLDDVVETVIFFLRPGAPSRVALELVGPERLSMAEVVARFRAWLGWRPARPIRVPPSLAAALYRLGDLAGGLGWRPPLRSAARIEIRRGAVGDPGDWRRTTGIAPRRLDEALAADPASPQDRWYARLYFLKPLIFVVFPLFWIATGLISLGPGFEIGRGLMERAGAGSFAAPAVIAGAIADIVVGMAIAVRRTARAGLWGAVALTVFYVVAGTLLTPELWREPLGPLLKIWPVLVLNFVALAVLGNRR